MTVPSSINLSDVALEYLDEIPYACSSFTDVFRCLLRCDSQRQPTCVAVKKWRVCRNQSAEPDCIQFTKRVQARLTDYNRLRHAQIVPILELINNNHTPLLIMPYFRNGNVLDYIARSPTVNVLELQLDIVAALDYMHSLSPPVAHGTLKASNVLITDSGKACISDACINMLPMPPCWTIENVVYARWLAPELLSSDAGSDDPSLASVPGDVYSFAMTSVEMYTGHRPFSHIRSRVAVVLKALQGERPRRPTKDEAPQLTDPVWSAMEHCWKEDPTSRPNMSIVGKWLRLMAEPP